MGRDIWTRRKPTYAIWYICNLSLETISRAALRDEGYEGVEGVWGIKKSNGDVFVSSSGTFV